MDRCKDKIREVLINLLQVGDVVRCYGYLVNKVSLPKAIFYDDLEIIEIFNSYIIVKYMEHHSTIRRISKNKLYVENNKLVVNSENLDLINFNK